MPSKTLSLSLANPFSEGGGTERTDERDSTFLFDR